MSHSPHHLNVFPFLRCFNSPPGPFAIVYLPFPSYQGLFWPGGLPPKLKSRFFSLFTPPPSGCCPVLTHRPSPLMLTSNFSIPLRLTPLYSKHSRDLLPSPSRILFDPPFLLLFPNPLNTCPASNLAIVPSSFG